MWDKRIDPFRILFHGYVVKLFYTDIPHSAVCFGHYLAFVPVIGRRRNHFIKQFGRTASANFVNTGNPHIFPAQHQVTRSSHRIRNLFLILMTGRVNAMGRSPFTDYFHKTFGIQMGTQAKQTVPRRLRFLPDVIP